MKTKHISCDSVTVMILAKKKNVNSKYATDVIKKQQKFRNFKKSGRGWKKKRSGKKGVFFDIFLITEVQKLYIIGRGIIRVLSPHFYLIFPF